MEVNYEVYAGGLYRGPLEELLVAARRENVPLDRLNLLELIEDFANHLNRLEAWPVAPVSEYLLLFSEMIRIKTRLLLPDPQPNGDAGQPEEEKPSRDFFAEASRLLKERASQRARLYENQETPLPDDVQKGETNYSEVTLYELIRAFQNVMATVRENTQPSVEITNEFTTEERMEYILERVGADRPRTFRDLLGERPGREEVIVTFLAILQLVKQHDLRLKRRSPGDPIQILRRETSEASREPVPTARSHRGNGERPERGPKKDPGGDEQDRKKGPKRPSKKT